jgi:hypothetical protein
MKSISGTGWTAFALACGVGCFTRNPPPPPPLCVLGVAQGQTLSVRLGSVYDATSDALYDPSTISPEGISSSSMPTCGGVDGLGPGSLVTLTLGPQLGSGDVTNETCTPFAQRPALPLDPLLLWFTVLVAPGETIAVSWAVRSGGLATVEGLLSPSRNPWGTATPRALPPLVLTRAIAPLDHNAGGQRCFDAWVATWEPHP